MIIVHQSYVYQGLDYVAASYKRDYITQSIALSTDVEHMCEDKCDDTQTNGIYDDNAKRRQVP